MEVCTIWEGSLEHAKKSLKLHEKQLNRLEKKRERIAVDIRKTEMKLNDVIEDINDLKRVGKDTSRIEQAPAFYDANIRRWEQEISEIDEEFATVRDMLHQDTDLIDFTREKVNEFC